MILDFMQCCHSNDLRYLSQIEFMSIVLGNAIYIDTMKTYSVVSVSNMLKFFFSSDRTLLTNFDYHHTVWGCKFIMVLEC